MDSKIIEPEINFRDILFFCLRKLVVMIIAGVVLGGVLFAYNIYPQKTTCDVLDITKRISESESDLQYNLRVQKIYRARVLCSMIKNHTATLEHEKEYISQSLYMQIDPDNVYQSTAQIVLTLDNNSADGIENALFDAYEREIVSGSYLTDYANSIGTNKDYLKELISFSTTAYNSQIITTDENFNNIDRVGSMYIKVIGPSEEIVNDLTDIILDKIDSVCVELNSSITHHEISLVGVQRYSSVNSAFRDAQTGHISHIQSLQEVIASYYNYLDEIAKDLGVSGKETLFNYFETHDYIEVEGVPTEVSERIINRETLIKPNLKYFGIGFGVGAIFVAFIFILIYLFGKKFGTQAKFFGIFPLITKIGVLKPLGKQSKYNRFINIKTEDDTKLSNENNLKLISANYKNLTKNYNNILITGTGDTKVMSDAVKSLKLKGDFRPDLFNNPDVLDDVTKYDGVVLIEQRNCSVIRTVKNEVRLISNGGTKIIGAIIL